MVVTMTMKEGVCSEPSSVLLLLLYQDISKSVSDLMTILTVDCEFSVSFIEEKKCLRVYEAGFGRGCIYSYENGFEKYCITVLVLCIYKYVIQVFNNQTNTHSNINILI